MKYKNLTELKNAYDTGELPEDALLILDNDCSSVYHNGVRVYDGPGYEIREELLDMLGIPWDNV